MKLKDMKFQEMKLQNFKSKMQAVIIHSKKIWWTFDDC